MTNLWQKVVGDKRRYRQYKAEIAELPQPYQDAMLAIQDYMWNFANGSGFMDALEEVLHLFEEGASDKVPLADLVGPDPVTFCETIMAQYPDDLWLIKYQNKLRQKIKNVEAGS